MELPEESFKRSGGGNRSAEGFYEWSASNKKKGGQVKMEKVMNEEKFGEWEEFVRSMNTDQ